MSVCRILILAVVTILVYTGSGESGWYDYTTADGLASNSVRAIVEDGFGNLWFGTGGGVSRYDGVSWRTFTTADGLADDYVEAIEEDSSGNLWFATWGGGVTRYDGTTWLTFTTADGLASNFVRAILEDSSGNLWVGTGGRGVSRYDGVSWRTFTTADGLASNRVESILEDSSGNLWVGTVDGVSRYDGVAWWTYDRLVGSDVRAVLEDNSGDLWFGTYDDGVWRYDGSAWRAYTTADGLLSDIIFEILEDSSGNLWLGTDGGASRFDGVSWVTYTTADGLPSDLVWVILEDSFGSFWFGTDGGASRYIYTEHNVGWRTYTTADGLADNYVFAILQDSSRDFWFGTFGGVSHYDFVNWVTYTAADGLPDDRVLAILEDNSGNLWFGTAGGVGRYDGVSWQTYTTADGLPSNLVGVILEDSSGNLWVGTGGGVARYDGISWQAYTTADGLPCNLVRAILEDNSGNLWFGTETGAVGRYDGENWVTYTTADGLGSMYVNAILEDRFGDLWFGLEGGVTRHEPDRVPPQTVISPRPRELSTSTALTITFAAAFREIAGIAYSHSFDGTQWSDWASTNFWQVTDLSDGEHVFMVRACDRVGNVDPTPVVCKFEIDATPPAPVIAFPTFGLAVRESIDVLGSASDLRFEKYRVDVRPWDAASWGLLAESTSPVTEGVLAGWNTSSLGDGAYELRLSVTDTLGLTGAYSVTATVDNHAPWAHETTPAVVSTARGGDVYTTDGRVHLYFPPHAFALDAEVDIAALFDSLVPDTLAGGAVCLVPGYAVSWEGSSLEKPATLEMSYSGLPEPIPDGRLSLYVFGADSTWERLGGTVEGSVQRISSPIAEPGGYAVFVETDVVPGAATLSVVSITPRVFSPHGGFAREEVGIGFTLGRSGSVTVKIYNRAGRLVREVITGESMGPGANLVWWDGRDADGGIVVDGLYLVSVEALGEKQVKTIAVVR